MVPSLEYIVSTVESQGRAEVYGLRYLDNPGLTTSMSIHSQKKMVSSTPSPKGDQHEFESAKVTVDNRNFSYGAIRSGSVSLGPSCHLRTAQGRSHEFHCIGPVVFAIFVGLPSLAVAIPLGLFAVLPSRRIRPIAVASAIVPMFVALGVIFNFSPLVLLLLLLVAVAGLGYLVQRLHRR